MKSVEHQRNVARTLGASTQAAPDVLVRARRKRSAESAHTELPE